MTKISTTFELSSKMTIGNLVLGLLSVGKSTDDILLTVHAAFPEAKTTRRCIDWYRVKFVAMIA
jgi:hypothetical protein